MSLWVRDSAGGERRLNYSYDENGNRVNPLIAPTTDTGEGERVSRTETEDVRSVSAWSTDALHQVAFGTWGAAVAQTKFDHFDAPTETIFSNAAGDEVSTIRYVRDHRGNVLEAVQCLGQDAPPFGKMLAATADATRGRVEGPVLALEPGAEQFRTKFTYNNAGLVIAQEDYFARQRIQQTVNRYNDHLDLQESMVESEAGRSESTFEYEYDGQQNWTRRIVHHLGADISDEYDRDITYFDE